MAPARSSYQHRPFGWVFIITPVILLLDVFSKHWVLQSLTIGKSLPLWPQVLHLTRSHNTGVAFSLFAQQPWLVNIGATMLLLGLCLALWINRNRWGGSFLACVATGFVLGGAIGNLLDRWTRGAVVDFIDVAVINYPIFNVADIAICCGAALWAWWVLSAPPSNTKSIESSHA